MRAAKRLPLAIVGGGVTGLAAGLAAAAPVYEQSDGPGGICRSYYLRPGDTFPLDRPPREDDAYRFEVGGGHWIFGGDPAVLSFLGELAPMRAYARRALVRVAGTTVPYPLQDHLDLLGREIAGRVESEAPRAPAAEGVTTLHDWLERKFGTVLCDLFFHPFNDRYTAGLAKVIAPQDGYKSPPPNAARSGYNATFSYPVAGLDSLAGALAADCDVRYSKRVVGIDVDCGSLQFADGSEIGFDALASTLPLSEAMRLAQLEVEEPPDPFTSVLVLNIGAARGPRCPDAHWQYEVDSRCGFHRIGFYSNVDRSFLPRAHRRRGDRVSLYVERAYPPGARPTAEQVSAYREAVAGELSERGYIGEVDVADPSWVETAYTWRSPGSQWRERAIGALRRHRIHQLGRYGTWRFQGIADSIREGLSVSDRLAAPAPVLEPA